MIRPFRYAHSAFTAWTTYGEEVRDCRAAVDYCRLISATRCANASSCAASTPARCAFIACHTRAMGVRSGL